MPISSWRRPTEKVIPATPENRVKSMNSVYLLQDVASIKAYLHKLRKVLQECEEKNISMNETSLQHSGKSLSALSEDEVSELKRQISVLKQQNLEKDKQIESLRRQLSLAKSPGHIARPAHRDVKLFSSQLFPSDPALNSSGESSSNSSPISDRLPRDRRPLVRRSQTPQASPRSMTILRSSENGILRIQIGSSTQTT